ncbi:MAG: PLD nuclease N-terminal domain-containing protein [Longimicrobiales bacterium]
MHLLLTLAIFGLDLWAIDSIFSARAPTRSKVFWTVTVVALPLAGLGAWWVSGRKHLRGEPNDPNPDPGG